VSGELNTCINRSQITTTALAPCVQEPNLFKPISKWTYDPTTYQLSTDDLCLTLIPGKADNIKLLACNTSLQQQWMFTDQVVGPFSIGSTELLEYMAPQIKRLMRNQVNAALAPPDSTSAGNIQDPKPQSQRKDLKLYKSKQFIYNDGIDFLTFPLAETVGENITFLTRIGAESLFKQQRQFIEGKTTDEANILANEIRMLNCEVKRILRGEMISLSSLDCILAAKVMNLNTCDRITTDGLLSILQTCEKREIDVRITITQCGPQVIYTDIAKNMSYSIAKNGYQLVPFAPCLHQQNIINLNDKFYSIKTGEFIQEFANIHPNTLKLIARFEELPLLQWDLGSHFESRYDHQNFERLDVLTQLISTLRESDTESLKDLIFQKQTKSNIINSFSWWDYIYYTLIAIAIFALLTLAIKIYNLINPNPTFRKILSSVSFVSGRAIWNDGCPITAA